MALPSTGWLDTNPDTEEVLPVMLPVFFAAQYKVGVESFISINEPLPSSVNIRFGDCVTTFDHGLNEEGTEYGLVVSIIRKGAFGSIVLDTLTIPEVSLNQLIIEFCPEPFDKVVEVCPETTDSTLVTELIPEDLVDTDEPILAPILLEDMELPCGMVTPLLFNGLRLFDGSWQFL